MVERITFDDKAYLVIPQCRHHRFRNSVGVQPEDQWWSKISRYPNSCCVLGHMLIPQEGRFTTTGGAAYKMTDSTWDRGAENRVAITAQAITEIRPRNVEQLCGSRCRLRTRLHSRVADLHDQVATNKPRTSTELVAAFGPGTGDTTSVGQVHVKSIDLKQREGYTAQITIWASGTGRCIIHPCRLIYERNPL